MHRSSIARGELAAMSEHRTLGDMNRAIEADRAAGDFLGLAFAKAVGRNDREAILGALARFRGARAKGIEQAVLLEDVPLSAGATAYAALVRRRSLLGRLPGARPAPPLVRLSAVASGSVAGFVSEGKPIPIDRGSLASPVRLVPGKVATIIPFSAELMRLGDPAAFNLMTGDLTRALGAGIDEALLDGASAVPEGRPASILEGVSAVGIGSPASLEDEVVELVKSVSGGEAAAPAFVASLSGALYLATVRDAGGDRLFPGVTLLGGELLGVPLLVAPAAASKLILVDAAQLFYSDSGVEIDQTQAAALQMSDAPVDGAANLVSLWQAGVIAIRAVQYVTWRLAHADAIGFVNLPLGSPVV